MGINERPLSSQKVLRLAGRVFCSFFLLLSLVRVADAQTNCATQHSTTGAFICYPNPSENPADSSVPHIFHLSAQGNAPDGQAIAGYLVLIDNRPIFETQIAVHVPKLSIETNLKSPFNSGSHTLRLVVRGARSVEIGSTEVKQLQFYPSKNASFCEPFSHTDPRVCTVLPIRDPLQWSLTEDAARTLADPFERYSEYIKLYGQNLKSVEADVADAMALDAQGNLFVASHARTDVDLREYAPNGSLIYASLIRSCGDGFLAVTGLAIDNAGRAWIAGNTSACLSTTSKPIGSNVDGRNQIRGFVMLVDMKKPSSAPPLYVTYLSEVDSQIAAIRVDREGNAYLTGKTSSLEFAHQTTLNVGESSTQVRGARIGFVSVLNSSGSGLLWSTLLQGAQLTSLALDGQGNVYLTGRAASRHSPSGPTAQNCGAEGKGAKECDDVLVAKLSDNGSRLSYLAQFGGSADEEGRAISADPQSGWIFIAADTDSPDLALSSAPNTSQGDVLRSIAIGLKPCETGMWYARQLAAVDNHVAPGMALMPALDAFTSVLSKTFNSLKPEDAMPRPVASVLIAPACSSTEP